MWKKCSSDGKITSQVFRETSVTLVARTNLPKVKLVSHPCWDFIARWLASSSSCRPLTRTPKAAWFIKNHFNNQTGVTWSSKTELDQSAWLTVFISVIPRHQGNMTQKYFSNWTRHVLPIGKGKREQVEVSRCVLNEESLWNPWNPWRQEREALEEILGGGDNEKGEYKTPLLPLQNRL